MADVHKQVEKDYVKGMKYKKIAENMTCRSTTPE